MISLQKNAFCLYVKQTRALEIVWSVGQFFSLSNCPLYCKYLVPLASTSVCDYTPDHYDNQIHARILPVYFLGCM